MSYFYIYKICNYLLMENQKYISRINNIINTQKIEGGAFNNMNKISDDFKANSNKKGYTVPSSFPTAMRKPPGMAKLANAAKAQIAAKEQMAAKAQMAAKGMPTAPSMGMPGAPSMSMPRALSTGIPKIPPMGMPGVPPMGMPGAPSMGMGKGIEGAPQQSENETNSELKNMVKSKENFEEYINKISNYIQMLGKCKKGEINEFIEKNNNSQQQISNNAAIENDLINQQSSNTEELSNVQKEKDAIKKESEIELKKAQDDLDKQKEEEAELKGRFEELTKEKKNLEAELEKAKATASQNATPTNDATAAALQEELDKLKQTEKDAKEQLEKEKAGITEKYEAILQKEQNAKEKMEAAEKRAQELEATMAQDKATIEQLQEKNKKIQNDNEEELKKQAAILAEKEAKINKIEAKLKEQNKGAQGKDKESTDEINSIRKAKENLEKKLDELKTQLSDAKKTESDKEAVLIKIKEQKKKLEKKLKDAKDAATKNGKPTNNDETTALNTELKDLEAQLEQKEKEKISVEEQKKKTVHQMEQLNNTLRENTIKLQEKDEIIKKNQNELKEMANIQAKLETEKVKLEEEKAALQQTNAKNADFKRQLETMQANNTSLENKLKDIAAKEKTYNQTLKDLEESKKTNASDKEAIRAAEEKEKVLRKQFERERLLLKQEIDELKKNPVPIPQPQIVSSNYNDTYRYSGFTLSFPSTSQSKFIELRNDSKNKTVKLCTNNSFVKDTIKNTDNYNYLIYNAGKKKFVVTGVNNYKLKYKANRIEENPGDARYLNNKPLNNLSSSITPKTITPEQFTILLQATDINKCIKLEFTAVDNDGSPIEVNDDGSPISRIVYVIPQSLDSHHNRYLVRGGGDKTNPEVKVLSMAKFKEIKESIDMTIIKVKEYQKKLLKEKRGNVKHKTKLSKIDKLIKIAKKINTLYEGTKTEKVKDSISNIGTGVKNLGTNISKGITDLSSKLKRKKVRGGKRKQGKDTIVPGGAFENVDFSKKSKKPEIPVIPTSLPPSTESPREIFKKIKEKVADTKDEENKDKGSKALTEKKCMELVKYLENFNEILKDLQNDTGDASIEQIKTDATNVTENSGKNELIDKMMDVQSKFNGTSSDGKPNNSTEILTISTMIIYDILLVSIVIICIIIYILFVINIIKFLYQCFLEVGNSQHNNLSTGATLRYKLLGYVVYINNCNLPGLFSSFNNVDSPSGTFMRLSKVLEKYFTNEQSSTDDDTFESIFGELADKVAIPQTPEEKAEEKHKKWLTEEGKDATVEAQEEHKEKLKKEEIESDKERKNTQYEENKNYKEPKFNIFLCIRLVFICIKLFITFITIIVISIITFILLSIVSQMANMDAIEIQIIKKQKLFFMLLQLLVVSIIHLFIKLIIYKTMFVKIYNKYLNTYLNIIAIDLKINSLKKSDDLEYIDKDLAIKLKSSIDNDSYIEERLIQLMNQDGVDNVADESIVKYITIYMLLKYLYSYDNNKSKYLLYYSYFINDGDYSFPAELNMEKNNITTFYSLIPNKHRKTPINYFKYSDIKNIGDIERAEKIRQNVNTYISQINTYIAEANSYFDDDNFIVSLGWYILINIILGTIYIIIIVTIILKETGIMTGGFIFEEFIRFE